MISSKNRRSGGDILREICNQKNISLSSLAEKIDTEPAQLYNITAKSSTRNISAVMAQKIRAVYPDIRGDFLSGYDSFMTQEDVDSAFSKAWEESELEEKATVPFLSALGYEIKPVTTNTIDSPEEYEAHEEYLAESITWHDSGKHEIWHNGSRIACGCTDREIDELLQEIRDIFEYTEKRIKRLVERKGDEHAE